MILGDGRWVSSSILTGEQFADEKERKARTLLLMAVPKDHLRRFHGMDDAKEIWAAIKTRFGAKASSSKHKPSHSSGSYSSYTTSSSKATPTATPGLADEIGRVGIIKLADCYDANKIKKFLQEDRPEGQEWMGKNAWSAWFKGPKEGLAGRKQVEEDIDDSLYEYGKYGPQPQSPSPTVSNASSIVFSICPSNDSDGELGAVSDASSTHYSSCTSNDNNGKLGAVSDHSVNDDPIHDHIPIPSIVQVTIDHPTTHTYGLESRMEWDLGAESFERKTMFCLWKVLRPPLLKIIKNCSKVGSVTFGGSKGSISGKGSKEVIDIDVQTEEAEELMVLYWHTLRAISPSMIREEASYDDVGIITDFNHLPDERKQDGMERGSSCRNKTRLAPLIEEGYVSKPPVLLIPDHPTKALMQSRFSNGVPWGELTFFFRSTSQKNREASLYLKTCNSKTSHSQCCQRESSSISKGKPKLGIMDFPRGLSIHLVAFSDSDYGGFQLDRKIHNIVVVNSLVKRTYLMHSAIASTKEDGSLEISATIDTIRYTISEASIRDSLQLDDATGITMLPNDDLFEGMGQIGYPTDGTFTFWKSFFTPQWRYLVHHLLHCISSKSGGWDQFGSNIATALICLSTGQEHVAQAQSQPSPTPPPIPTSTSPPPPIPSPTPPPIPTPTSPTPPPIPTPTSHYSTPTQPPPPT
ncbi:hypothetical protein Tco_1449704 [Tanacetum coccineum]